MATKKTLSKKTAKATTKKSAKKATKRTKKATKKAASKSGGRKRASAKKALVPTGKYLVVVESPAKARTIGTYLGQDWIVQATMGHVMDLPVNRMGIDVENGFTAEYEVIKGRKKQVTALKKAAKSCDEIFLAQDPDREGEAISWHLAELLGRARPIRRVVFHEITKEAIRKAFDHPGDIDLQKVNAQQTRRILDRIVGYSLSPLLWRKVGRGLSAGRVQSVTLRLVVDREREIEAFTSEEYWQIEAALRKQVDGQPVNVSLKIKAEDDPNAVLAMLDKIKGEKAKLNNESDAQAVVKRLQSVVFTVDSVEQKSRAKNPQPPFITSTLQQEAFNKLRFPAERTMRIAQGLYEGVELGAEGSTGLITYMRTDSVKVSTDAEQTARQWIQEHHGKEYVPEKPRRYRSKKQAQEAHEAIRPTDPTRHPDQTRRYLSDDQHKLYSLIWRRFVASQMMSATYAVTTVTFAAADCQFRSTGSVLKFPGFTILAPEKGEGGQKNMPELTVGETLDLLQLTPSQHFTKPPPHYTDASLVRAMEEKGIGRPSTYAPTIRNIVSRDYIRRQGGSLLASELGKVVTDLLTAHFPRVLDDQFTASMEEQLDKIEEGGADWVDILQRFYGPFKERVAKAQEEMKNLRQQVVPTDEICDDCELPLVIKWGRRGRFLSCSGWPNCRFAKSITTKVPCPEPDCAGELVERRTRAGKMFYGCSKYPDCTHIARRLPTAEDEEVAEDASEQANTTSP